MALTGYLSEYSLPEIFQFVEQGYKTGLLSIQPDPSQQQEKHYLWFQAGRIIAVADQLDNKCLLSMLNQRGWLNSQTTNLLPEWSDAQPLGLYLKAQQAITAEQIKLLFHAQVLRPVCSLFKLENALFAFEPKTTLPKAEMTGLSVSATEATLLGLRVLRDWTALAEKLPDPTVGITKAIKDVPQLQLDSQEQLVWESADATVSLSSIAKQLQLPVETVQQIAFRLSVVGLVEEVAITAPQATQPVEEKSPMTMTVAKGEPLKVAFLQNLVGFLKKVA